ncbi:unnamed protein product, partial [marine sediment metagenome]
MGGMAASRERGSEWEGAVVDKPQPAHGLCCRRAKIRKP